MAKNNKTTYFSLSLVGGLAIAALGFWGYSATQPGNLDEFAQCLEDSGAVFYGTFWCPYCQNQKKLFGKSAGLLPYFECSTRDGRSQIDACKEKNIEGYPTWEFADGSRETGELPLQLLAEKTGCQLPTE